MWRRDSVFACLVAGLFGPALDARAQDATPDPGSTARGWIADGRVGAPILESGLLRFVASGMLGHRGTRLELIASAGVYQYASAGDHVFNTTARSGWQLHGAYLTGSEDARVRALIVQDLAQALYLTRYLELPDSGGGSLLDFDLSIKNELSNMMRETTFVGCLLAPTPRTQVRLALGLGLQAELYVMTLFDRGDTSTRAGFDLNLQVSLRQQWQLFARHELVEDRLALRVFSDSSTFRISRSSAAVTIDFTRISESEASASVFRYRQLESANRAALDLDALTVVGVMPSVFGGLDLSLLRGDVGSATAVVPVFGIGLTNGRL